MTSAPHGLPPNRSPGILLGLGLGGFLDGILLHQIIHWHNMGSAKLPPVTLEALRQNMRWDGFFHAAVWLLTVAGVYLLVRDGRQGYPLPTASVLTGQLLLGWGIFNLVEGTIDHLILGIHHVRDLPVHVPLYDWIFLLVGGIGFVLAGYVISSRARNRPG
jgi:uncharacterized membrane protein